MKLQVARRQVGMGSKKEDTRPKEAQLCGNIGCSGSKMGCTRLRRLGLSGAQYFTLPFADWTENSKYGTVIGPLRFRSESAHPHFVKTQLGSLK